MKISVVTVCYNSENTVARTIESVLAQTYSELEYIIVDGVSTDKTLDIAESYRDEFTAKGIEYRISSEPDDGIYDAMNKGVALSTGELVGIINSDDWYEPDALQKVAEAYGRERFEVLFATVRIHKAGLAVLKKPKLKRFITSRHWNHPTMFLAKAVYEREKFALESVFDDFDLYLRLRRQNRRFALIDDVLANFAVGGVSTKKSWAAAMRDAKARYRVYRKNGYGRLYWFECVAQEFFKKLFAGV